MEWLIGRLDGEIFKCKCCLHSFKNTLVYGNSGPTNALAYVFEFVVSHFVCNLTLV